MKRTCKGRHGRLHGSSIPRVCAECDNALLLDSNDDIFARRRSLHGSDEVGTRRSAERNRDGVGGLF